MVGFPYYSHTIPISLGILMGIVWEAYHKGVPLLGVLLLGVPENLTDLMTPGIPQQPSLEIFKKSRHFSRRHAWMSWEGSGWINGGLPNWS